MIVISKLFKFIVHILEVHCCNAGKIISKLFKFIVHDSVQIFKFIQIFNFKTFQVYSSLIKCINSCQMVKHFKTFQVYSSLHSAVILFQALLISKLFKFIVHKGYFLFHLLQFLISKLFKFIVHFGKQTNRCISLWDFKTFQVYSSCSNKECYIVYYS